MDKEKKKENKQEQKNAMVNLWMTDLKQSPEEKAQQEKEIQEKEAKRQKEIQTET